MDIGSFLNRVEKMSCSMTYRRRDLLGLIGMCLTTGCLSSQRQKTKTPSDWPSFGRTHKNTRFSSQGVVPDRNSSPDWSTTHLEYPVTSPVVISEFVLAGSKTRGWAAYNQKSGEKEWRTIAKAQPSGTPVGCDQRVIVPEDGRFKRNGQGMLRSLRLETGEQQWQRELDDETLLAPTISDSGLYVRSGTSCYAIDQEDGSVQWSLGDRPALDAPNYDVNMDVRPAVAADTVVFPEPSGLVATTSNGDVKWERSFSKVRSAPVIQGETVYLADVEDGVYALDLDTGQTAWTWSASGCWNSPAIGENHLYVTSGFDVTALRTSDGSVKWRLGGDGLQGDTYTSPAVIGGRVVVGSNSHAIVIIEGGNIRWRFGSGTRTSHAVADGTIFVTGKNGSDGQNKKVGQQLMAVR